MKKIIKIDSDIIFIGCEDGSIKEVRKMDCSNFEPAVGDLVEIFSTETRVIVTKKEPEAKQETPAQNSAAKNGINININSSSNTTIPQAYIEASGVSGPRKAVNKVAYCLLALFLGGLGGHKFYAGKIGMGFLYLIFCWTYIPSIIAFIEFIIALCKPADANGMIIV